MKRTYPQSISEIIEQLFKENDLEDTLLMHRAMAAWPQVVGAAVNRQTVARRVDSGTLYVRIISAPMRQELSLHSTELLCALNKAAGAQVLNQIKFV